MFNAEKYIAECLDSLLTQTFTNFEVIIVDDCSTDNSIAIVESYASKFNGRLTLSHMETNSGSGALPRNKGLELSRGEYVYFMDADDLFTKTALEELYALAKDFDADVVYCEKNYQTNNDGSNLKVTSCQKGDFVDRPTFDTEDLSQRVMNILETRYWVTPWNKFVRRRLIVEHEIFFPPVKISEDTVWTWGLVLYAKKFLRVPNIIYIRRLSEDSMMRTKRTPQRKINFWLNPVLFGLKSLDKFMSKVEFLRQNPSYRYAVLENFVVTKFNMIFKDSAQLPPFVTYETLKHEFGDKLGEHDVLICAMCTVLNTQQKINVANIQQFNQFVAHTQTQVDQFAAAANKRIAELEAEVKRLQSSRDS